MARIGVDLTAAWRARVGMVSVSVSLARALLIEGAEHAWTVFSSRERLAGLPGCDQVLSPHRHEIPNKLLWMRSLEATSGLDAILYPYWPAPPVRRKGAPRAIVFVHDLAFRLLPAEVPWQQRFYLGSVLPPALRQAAAVCVPSETTRRDLLDAFPLPGLADRVVVVPWGPTELPAAGPLPPQVARPGFLLAVGTVEPRKNYPRLVQAYGRLRCAMPEAPPLVVVGRTGWAFGNALDLLRSAPGVHLLGHVSDAELAALLQGAAALAFPSLYEGFGLPLLDAMGAGLPALIGDRGALPELAGEAALAVDAEDPEAIASGLERILADQELRSRLAAAGRARAAAFTWPAAARRVLEMLD